MSQDPKALRKQLRNVVQEILPDLIKQELYKAIQQELHLEIKKIEETVKTSMREMTERQKDVLGYLVRQVSTPNPTDTK